MADHGDGGEGGLGGNFVLIFFGLIFAFWFITGAGQGPGLFGTATSSTAYIGSSTREYTYERPTESQSSADSKISDIGAKVDRLTEEVKDARLWGVRSPYAGTIRISRGDTASNDEDQEYLTLYNNGTDAVTISGWELRGSVTDEGARIPQGADIPRSGRLNDTAPIVLGPGESALVVSGDAPTGVSFRENMCTGYFEQYQEFHPSLTRSCPYPKDEMERFGNIALDDDRCYDFVETLPSCEVARVEAQDAHIGSSCEAFVENDLTYSGCVTNHRYDQGFKSRTWRVYLGSNNDLWREEREIIKLLDGSGATVDVLEY